MSNGYFKENYNFQRFQSEGVQHFPGEGGTSFFQGETHITCDFPGGEGGPDPLSPPLDPHMVLTGNMFSNFRTF